MKKKIERLKWLEQQIEVQQDALCKAWGNMMYVHAGLLQILTDEWCALTQELGDKALQ